MTFNELKNALAVFEEVYPHVGEHKVAITSLHGDKFTATHVQLLAPPMQLEQNGTQIPVVMLVASHPEQSLFYDPCSDARIVTLDIESPAFTNPFTDDLKPISKQD